MMKFAYYPGCSLNATAKEYDMSIKAVSEALGIELVELEDWNCCGATAAHSIDHLLAVALPARNLAIAERESMDILAPCAGCFHFQAKANEQLKENKKLKNKINKVLETIGFEYGGSVEVKHPLDVIVNDLGLDKIKDRVENPGTGLKIAPYYGCMLVKPSNICKFDSPENPQTLDQLIKVIGGECVPFHSYKAQCCGGSLILFQEEAAHKLTSNLLVKAEEVGAQCIATTCPFCQFNLDLKQKDIRSAHNLQFKMPILYFTQLLGLTLGLKPNDLGLDKNMVSTTKIVDIIAP